MIRHPFKWMATNVSETPHSGVLPASMIGVDFPEGVLRTVNAE